MAGANTQASIFVWLLAAFLVAALLVCIPGTTAYSSDATHEPGFFSRIWCDIRLIFDPDNDCLYANVIRAKAPETQQPLKDIAPAPNHATTSAFPNPFPSPNPSDEPYRSGQVAGATYVTNEYVTHPVTYVYQTIEKVIRDTVGQNRSSGVSRELFDAQVVATLTSIEEGDSGIQESIATAVTTGALTVTGNSNLATSTIAALTVSGDTAINGTLTAGTLSVSGVASAGAVAAPYFTATGTTEDSNFHNALHVEASSGRVGIGTSSPGHSLDVVGQLNLQLSGSNNSVLISNNGQDLSSSRANGSVIIGGRTANGNGNTDASVIIGPNAETYGGNGDYYNTVLGYGAKSTAELPKNVVLGALAETSTNDSVALGYLSKVFGASGIGIGSTATASGTMSIALGRNAIVTGNQSASIGGFATISADDVFTYGHDVDGANGGNTKHGFGTSSPNARLSVRGIGTGTAFAVADSSNTPRFSVLDNGKVGIGTTNPGKALVVEGAMSFLTSTTLRGLVGPPSWSTSYMAMQNGTLAEAPTNAAIGQSPAGYTFVNAASGQDLELKIANSPIVTVKSTANVGIGTANPSGKFHVAAPGAINSSHFTGDHVRIDLLSSAATNDAAVRFGNGAPIWALGTLGSSVNGTGDFFLNEIGVGTPLAVKKTTGNVGIGTPNPASKLHVSGGNILIDHGQAYYSSGSSGTVHTLAQVASDSFLYRSNHPSGHVYLGLLNAAGTGDIHFQTRGQNRAIINDSGHFVPGADNSYTLGASGSDWECIYYEGGNLGTCASDERLKTNIEPLSFEDDIRTAIEKVAGLAIRSFAFKSASDDPYHGLIAQEVAEIAPELVTETDEGFLAVKYADIPWLLLEAIQDLYAEVKDLTARVAQMRQRFISEEITATNRLCIDNTCLSEDELQHLLDNANLDPADTSTPPSDREDQAEHAKPKDDPAKEEDVLSGPKENDEIIEKESAPNVDAGAGGDKEKEAGEDATAALMPTDITSPQETSETDTYSITKEASATGSAATDAGPSP